LKLEGILLIRGRREGEQSPARKVVREEGTLFTRRRQRRSEGGGKGEVREYFDRRWKKGRENENRKGRGKSMIGVQSLKSLIGKKRGEG